MEIKVYAIKDVKAGTFNQPFLQPTHGTAERSFQELVRDPQSFVSKYPEDYDLYFLGSFDDLTGGIKSEKNPVHIINAAQLKNGEVTRPGLN